MKKYTISLNKIPHNTKPSKKEIAKISNSLYTYDMEYTKLAHEVGERGCTFSPAIYNGKRKKDNYIGQQLIALDFDNGVSFAEIKNRAEHYRLPILFAYKTFSYTEEHEKFRIVFALSGVIEDLFTSEAVILMFMKIFNECDGACKDSSRMFFGGKGLLEFADEPAEITFEDMCIECKKLTDMGCNVIIFPEGTRTPRHGKNNYKKGAARIALYCGCDVQPVFIGGSDKYGLGKHDPLWSYNHVEPYLYDFKLLPVIFIDEYKDLSEPIAAKRLTDKMEEVIKSAGDDYYKNYSGKSRNNY